MSVTTGTAGVDGGLFREAMAGVCAPVSIVTTLHDGVPHETMVSAFAALSADPPLVSVALDTGSRVLARVRLSAVPRLDEPLTYHNRAFGTHLPQQVEREEKA